MLRGEAWGVSHGMCYIPFIIFVCFIFLGMSIFLIRLKQMSNFLSSSDTTMSIKTMAIFYAKFYGPLRGE